MIPCLLRLRQRNEPMLQGTVRQALALVGYTDPVKGRGIRVLSIDGGGTRYPNLLLGECDLILSGYKVLPIMWDKASGWHGLSQQKVRCV